MTNILEVPSESGAWTRAVLVASLDLALLGALGGEHGGGQNDRRLGHALALGAGDSVEQYAERAEGVGGEALGQPETVATVVRAGVKLREGDAGPARRLLVRFPR